MSSPPRKKTRLTSPYIPSSSLNDNHHHQVQYPAPILSSNVLPFLNFTNLLQQRLVCREFNSFVEDTILYRSFSDIVNRFRHHQEEEDTTMAHELADELQRVVSGFTEAEKDERGGISNRGESENSQHLASIIERHMNQIIKEREKEQPKSISNVYDEKTRQWLLNLYHSMMNESLNHHQNDETKTQTNSNSTKNNRIFSLLHQGNERLYQGAEEEDEEIPLEYSIYALLRISPEITQIRGRLVADVSLDGIISGRGRKLDTIKTKQRQRPETLFRIAFFLRCIFDRIIASGNMYTLSQVFGGYEELPTQALILQMDCVHELDTNFQWTALEQAELGVPNCLGLYHPFNNSGLAMNAQDLTEKSEMFATICKLMEMEQMSEISMEDIPSYISGWYVANASRNDVLTIHRDVFIPFFQFFETVHIIEISNVDSELLSYIFIVGKLENYMAGLYFIKENNS